MQVSLRKANAIQVAINEVLKGLEFKSEISINEFQKPEAVIEAANSAFYNNLGRRNALLSSLYEIRKATAAANAANNIDNLLADLALFEKDIAFFSAQAKVKERLDSEVIHGKLVKIANRAEDSYYAKAEVETSVFTKEDISEFNSIAVQVKKKKQKLQDELLELNIRTTITLSDETVATLTREDIL